MSGQRYVYAGVSSELFATFAKAASRGLFFNREIRDRYPIVR